MTQDNANLIEYLDKLSEIQRTCVSWTEGPLVVLAGPGSGKTMVLTARVARLLDESRGQSFRVLAVTFTNRAADEMRERIEKLVPDLERRLFVGTFHGFCAEVLRQDGIHVGLKSDFKIYSVDSERADLLDEVLKKNLKNEYLERLQKYRVLPMMDRLRTRLVEVHDAEKYLSDIEIGDAVASAYKIYDNALKESNGLDFSSLLFYSYKLFNGFPSIAKKYQKTYRYWCLDEFQDTNEAQYNLVLAMAVGGFNNIFIVADDDQIIYQWNGASYQRLEQFSRNFEPELLQLPTNYRCPAEIIEIANKLVSNNKLRSKNKSPLTAVKQVNKTLGNGVITLNAYKTSIEEVNGVIEFIKRMDGKERDNATVLARARALLEPIQSRLTEEGINATIVQRRNEFQSAPYRFLQACLRQSLARSDRRNAEILVESFNAVSGLTVSFSDVDTAAQSGPGDYLRAWANAVSEAVLASEAEDIPKRVMQHLVDSSNYRAFSEYLVKFVEATTDIESDEIFSGLADDHDAWSALYRDITLQVGQGATLEVFLQELDMRSKEPPLRSGTLKLMTIHASKGNEFDVVFLIGLAEDVLPSYQSLKKGADSPEMEEERRNCFVAITRAKERLVMSYAREYRGWNKKPSRFLCEMGLV